MVPRFNLADFVEALEMPLWITHNSAWISHIPMASVLVKLLQPARLVELGTFRGDSYMAFCQAVKRLALPTQCTAVDTWRGDAHAGFYGPQVLLELRATHDPLYGAFSKLRQGTFAEALDDFADGSIDLLHVDGHHTYDAVKEDFQSWLPKMSTRGVILFHDTAVREGDFGVWKLWEEIEGRGPSFNVTYGCGLGILAVGAEVPRGIVDFLQELREFGQVILPQFLALAGRIELTRTLMGVANDLQNGQAVLNEWRKLRGLAVTQAPFGACDHPRRFAGVMTSNLREAAADSVLLVQENTALKQRAASRIGVVRNVVERMAGDESRVLNQAS